jgi:3-dehydroquinate dehydratase/shikimate dehydrogenase
MAKVCLCLTGKTLDRDLEILNKYRKYVDIAELRADCLDPDERFLLRRFPGMANIPVILTIRRNIDGGGYVGGEGARITLLSMGLAFADADRRRNFAYVDLEEDLNVPSLEEAARAFGTRIIRSYHNMNAVDAGLTAKLRNLRRVGDELVKVAVMPRNLDDVIRVYEAGKATLDIEKILLCMGDFGINTRILAEQLGSFLSYTAVKGEQDFPAAAPGQLDPRELVDTYRFREITPATRIFAVTGFPLKVSASPPFFNTVFSIERNDAVYIPVPADSINSFIRLAEELKIAGVSVTVPYKEAVLPFLSYMSDEVIYIGACNTVVASPQGWMGYNTDAPGFSDSLLEFSGRRNLRGRKITIVGAGGAARAIASAVYQLKGKALILNRTAIRAREVALPYSFAWAGLDNRGIELMNAYSDIIIQTTPVGMAPNVEDDPLEFYQFTGKELVMDIIYKPEKTKCLRRAEAAGCRICNGYDMLLRQARYQYKFFMRKEFPPSLVNKVGF